MSNFNLCLYKFYGASSLWFPARPLALARIQLLSNSALMFSVLYFLCSIYFEDTSMEACASVSYPIALVLVKCYVCTITCGIRNVRTETLSS